MKIFRAIAAIFAAIVLIFGNGAAFSPGGTSASHFFSTTAHADGVRVRGYLRKDGTYVARYTQHLPATTHGVTDYSAPVHREHTATDYTATDYEAHVHRTHIASGYVGARDASGRIIRSEAPKREFMRMTGFPHGRPGYVVDHIIALKRGGPDTASNMQWQTIEEAKAKDRWE